MFPPDISLLLICGWSWVGQGPCFLIPQLQSCAKAPWAQTFRQPWSYRSSWLSLPGWAWGFQFLQHCGRVRDKSYLFLALGICVKILFKTNKKGPPWPVGSVGNRLSWLGHYAYTKRLQIRSPVGVHTEDNQSIFLPPQVCVCVCPHPCPLLSLKSINMSSDEDFTRFQMSKF